MAFIEFFSTKYRGTIGKVTSQSGGAVTGYTDFTHDDKKWSYPVVKKSDIDSIARAETQIGTCSASGSKLSFNITDTTWWASLCSVFGKYQGYYCLVCNGYPCRNESDLSLIVDFIESTFEAFVILGTITDGNGGQQLFPEENPMYAYDQFGRLDSHYTGWATFRSPIIAKDTSDDSYHWYTLRVKWFLPGASGMYGGQMRAELVADTSQRTTPLDDTPYIPSNPYPNIPNSDTSGGGGSGTDTSDSNPVPLLPSVSAIGTGMCRLYNPTVAQLIDLGAWLWGSGLDLTQLKKIFSDPMDVILGCSVFPVSMPTETTPQTIVFGNIDSQISSRVVSSQYTSYDLGKIDVTSYYNSYLDFSPYTKMQIYLPFIGMKSINVDEFMSTASVTKRIGVTYSIDLLSGACVAHIYLNKGSTSTLLYEFGGTCNTQIPLNSRDYTATVQSLLGIVGGSAAAGVAAFMLPEAIPAVVGAAGVVGGMVMNAAKNTVASKPTVEHAGGIGGSTGIMGSRKAYLIIERPNLCHPENQQHFTGYPGFLYRTVNQLNGYTKFINFELQNIHATEPELEEIKEWFTVKGVLL